MQKQAIGAPPDIELAIPKAPKNGYPALAAWIAHDPDNESYVFRKFDRLSARNLLYLQSELIALEEMLDQLDRETQESKDVGLRLSAQRWETFVENAKDPSRPENGRMELAKVLQKKIKEYHEALLLQSQIANLDRPSSRVLTVFRNWFSGKNRDSKSYEENSILSGRAKFMLDDEKDLAALRPPTDKDALSRFLQDHWPFQDKAYPDPGDRTRHFLERHVIWTVAFISIVIAAILLIGAITSLYFVTSPGAKLGMISGFTVLFAISVGLLTNAKRSEMFAATAAYSAVLVVFVSGNLSYNNAAATPP
ncbi:hypothetical protein AOQ84DRAFT_433802 [Glonium stellatum]|uniref:DUF6594 domain-containing protein n=1 Tax=Glonium stellatum TaxID=574774 RepID=A0A8E2JNL6_9PEZI|nr:hypothetical protein AOQ84DRAFT_433802 [Glonium stellatum]